LYILSLALGFSHPDYLLDTLSDKQIDDWRNYYRQYPFGHWIDTQMRAQISASMTDGNIILPSVKVISEDDEASETEKIIAMPGFGGAEKFLQELQRGNNQNA